MWPIINHWYTVYPKEYAHGFCFAVLCRGYTLADFPISIRLTSLALWQSNDCPSASKATLMNMDKYFMWIHYERLHNHNKAKHNKTVCIFLETYCILCNQNGFNRAAFFPGWRVSKYIWRVSNIFEEYLNIFEVKLTFEMLAAHGQQHTFSTHERIFLWKCQSFWDRKCLDLKGTSTPSLQIHVECSNYLNVYIYIHICMHIGNFFILI